MKKAKIKSGALTAIASEPLAPRSYLTVFTTHFLSFPSQNFRILRKLYIENAWTPTQIQKFTGWHEASVRSGAKRLGLKKDSPSNPQALRYGWKRDHTGNLVHHKSQQKALDYALDLFRAGNNLLSVCKKLNDNNIRTSKGRPWESKVLKTVLMRERGDELKSENFDYFLTNSNQKGKK